MIKLIYAQSLNNVIGKDGKLPWHIPEDLIYFKEQTKNFPVVMGRKTWDSLPNRVKPLPGRLNVIITQNIDFKVNTPNVIVRNNLEDFILAQDKRSPDTPLWVIGGEAIFNIALPYAEEIHITEVLKEVEGDTFAPKINVKNFRLVNLSEVLTSATGIQYQHKVYKHK